MRRPCPLALCKAAADSDAGGQFLHQLLYRFRCEDALRVRGKHRWVAQAARCWMDELGFSKHKYEAALSALLKSDLVEVNHWPIRSGLPVKITHIRPTEKGLAVISPSNSARDAPENRGPNLPKNRKSPPRNPDNRLDGRGVTNGTYHDREQGNRKEGESSLPSCSLERGSETDDPNQVEFEQALDIEREAHPDKFNLGLAELIRHIERESHVPMVYVNQTQLTKFKLVLSKLKRRARNKWMKGVRPIPPEHALDLAVNCWHEFRAEFMPPGDPWPVDFVPGFVVHKADMLYDFLVHKRDAPKKDEYLSKFKGQTDA